MYPLSLLRHQTDVARNRILNPGALSSTLLERPGAQENTRRIRIPQGEKSTIRPRLARTLWTPTRG